MDLNTVWFILITVLFTGFFLLEGFDYGVGILLPFLGKDDTDRRVIINTIGPVWDGNEVWMITAGGAMFAAFPEWYATLFSGFYLALLLMLLALIGRGVAFEFRSKDRHPSWRKLWDWLIFAGSLVPALLWGVAFGNMIRGVPINADMHYVGGFWNLLNPYALSTGLAALSAFMLHGATFLSLKTKGEMAERAHRAAARLWLPTVVLVLAFVIASYLATDMFIRLGINPGTIPLAAGIALLVSGWFIRQRRHGWAFVMTGLTIALTSITVAMGLYPRVMVSSLSPAWSLTIYNASSSPYTLQVMTIVALIFVPIVLLYQGWSYWVFRKRIGREDTLEY
ncbi:MAG TPA: cytochrome d ubiquinol oxidase subunit II [Anaerolineae bacterium]|nr:cytochrome d ubiquinol oxidase subunit II [Anaerolineae bacterium]